MSEHGHSVLRLPPYHPDLNPIENIWADMKQEFGANNVTFTLDAVQKDCERWFHECGIEKWRKVCAHVERIEREYIEKEGIREDAVERIIIQLRGNSSDESESDSESSDSEMTN